MARYIAFDEKKIKRLKREAQRFQDDIVCAVGTDFMQNIAEAENKMIFDILKGLEDEPTADVVPKSEVERLEYTLLGVMHSVDKWLDGKELEQDEVNRAITMREKTLQIVEKAKSEVARVIFEEIESVLCRSVYPRVNQNGTITPISSKDWRIRCDDYNAIKKKYVGDNYGKPT